MEERYVQPTQSRQTQKKYVKTHYVCRQDDIWTSIEKPVTHQNTDQSQQAVLSS
jgi:hypothetical protein